MSGDIKPHRLMIRCMTKSFFWSILNLPPVSPSPPSDVNSCKGGRTSPPPPHALTFFFHCFFWKVKIQYIVAFPNKEGLLAF